MNYWSWTGRPVGFRAGAYLYNWSDQAVGKFKGQDVYGPDGFYLGEVRSRRLIRNPSRSAWRIEGFPAATSGGTHRRPGRHAGHVMLPGFEDFPDV
jgi:hypothetical protein